MLKINNLSKRFTGMERPAVSNVTIEAEIGEIVALAGASGSGKTTILRLIAGFDRPDAGTIRIDGTLLSDERRFVPPEHRRVGVVFQNFALFPHLTVAENVGFGITRRRKAVPERVHELLETAGIPELTERYPHEISGGQQQRVALARALAPRPEVVLLDEPFSNLDHTCTHRLLAETRQIIKESGATAIIVSHDRYEAFTLADRIAVLNDGVLEQFGSAEEIYARPQTRRVAEFSGSASFIPVEREKANGRRLLSPLGPIPPHITVVDNDAIAVARPNDLRIVTSDDISGIAATVTDVRFLGAVTEVHLKIGSVATVSRVNGSDRYSQELLVHVDRPRRDIVPGQQVAITWATKVG